MVHWNQDERRIKKGYWIEEEHDNFLQLLVKHGYQWAKMTAHFENRNIEQIRSHWAKFFKRVKKNVSKEVALELKSALTGIQVAVKATEAATELAEKEGGAVIGAAELEALKVYEETSRAVVKAVLADKRIEKALV